jgi:osmotically-inducible protein OsmY
MKTMRATEAPAWSRPPISFDRERASASSPLTLQPAGMPVKKKTDSQIKRAIAAELERDPRVHETDIGVSVHSSIVTLTGTVDDAAARVAATEAAHRVPEVLDVADDIKVKSLRESDDEPDDAEIAETVRRALERAAGVHADRIVTTVASGIVTLEGTVNLQGQGELAGRSVSNLLGVRWVNNMLILNPPPAAAGLEPAPRVDVGVVANR